MSGSLPLIRFTAALWVMTMSLVMRPVPSRGHSLQDAFAYSVLDMLPAIVGFACVIRWVNGLALDESGFALATRWATLLAIAGALAPFVSLGMPPTTFETWYRLGQASVLMCLLGGGVSRD